MFASRRQFLGVALLMAAGSDAVVSAPQDAALTLLVYERAGCPWCARWDAEIAPVLPRTDVGKRVQLRRINLDHAQPDDPKLDDPVRFTPTFVLLKERKEFGRITGYHDDGFFWGALEKLVQKSLTAAPLGSQS
jgi:thioredoxin-related protein